MMSMFMPTQLQLLEVSPWDINLNPSSEELGWVDRKIMSSSGDLSSASPSPDEGLTKNSILDTDLSRKLAEKLLELEPLEKTFDEDRVPLDQLYMGQPPNDSNNYICSNWGNSYVNETYRSVNPRFKTEICRNYKEKGSCLYGQLCQFAHGERELRKDMVRHNKYKTKLCQKYWIAGYCAYGQRCNFIHQEIDKEQALRIMAEMFDDTRNPGGFFGAANKSSINIGDVKPTLFVPNEFERNLSQMRLSGGKKDPSSYFSCSPVDFDLSVASALPRNFGLKEERCLGQFSRRPIGSERHGQNQDVGTGLLGY